MSRLNKNPQGAIWALEPAIPDPADPVKAWLMPGAVRPAYQALSDRVWSIASGAHNLAGVFIDPAQAQQPSAPLFNEVLVVVGSSSFVGLIGSVWRSDIPLDPRTVQITPTSISCAGGASIRRSTGVTLEDGVPRDADIVGRLVRRSLVRAWGWIQLRGGAVLEQDGVGYTSAAVLPNKMLRVTLSGPMSGPRYGVDARVQYLHGDSATAEPRACSVRNRTPTTFDIWTDTNSLDLSANDCEIEFTLKGNGRP